MATQLLEGFTTWNLTEDKEGHRDYEVAFLVQAAATDGPFAVRNTAGLPLPGAPWAYGSDLDPAATCKRDCKINPVQTRQEAAELWEARFRFSTRPDKRCQDNRFEDPLLEPQKVSGSFTKYREAATENRFGIPLRSSSHERLRGPELEFDNGLPTVRVEQNVLNLELPTLAIQLHTVNSVPMWGLPERCVKLSGVSWSQEFYGSCYRYFKRVLEFEVNPKTFDKQIADEGTKVLYGRWERPGVWRLLCIDGDVPDRHNPAHFIDFTFPSGNPGHVVLNGKGLPAGVCVVWDRCAGHELRGGMLCLNTTGTGPENYDNLVQTLTGAGSYTNYFISVWSNNRGALLGDAASWVNVVGSITPQAWVELRVYDVGSLVTNENKVWVAVAASRGAEPTGQLSADRPLFSEHGHWLQLGDVGAAPTDRGVYNQCTTYNLGDYVVESATTGLHTGTAFDVEGCDKTRPGKIDVEVYHETNLLLLGVPLLL